MKNLIKIFIIVVAWKQSFALAGQEQMKNMPILKEKKEYAIPSNDAGNELQETRGYGDKEPEVRMMNLMMVGGSGFEGMDMSQMKMAEAKKPASNSMDGMKMDGSSPNPTASQSSAELIEMIKSPSGPKTGASIYEFSVKDKAGKILKGLKLKVQVYMLSMDMGTDTPKVTEVKPGVYQTKAGFSMSGPWAIKITAPETEKVFEIQVGQ